MNEQEDATHLSGVDRYQDRKKNTTKMSIALGTVLSDFMSTMPMFRCNHSNLVFGEINRDPKKS